MMPWRWCCLGLILLEEGLRVIEDTYPNNVCCFVYYLTRAGSYTCHFCLC
jgi:hypothetical protein